MESRRTPRAALPAICAALLLAVLPNAAAQSAYDAPEWVLAAAEFTVEGGEGQGMGALLSTLVLDRISRNLTRETTRSEMYERARRELLTERQALLLELSSAYRTRDALVLSESSPRRLVRRIADADETIADVKARLDENLSDTERLRCEYDAAEAQGEDFEGGAGGFPFNPLTNLFVRREEPLLPESVSESVTLYQNDAGEVFHLSDEALEAGFASRAAEREATDAGISALLTARILVYGEYFSAECALIGYPGGATLGEVTEAGALPNLTQAAENIADYFIPVITNALPAELYFDIDPRDIADDITVVADGVHHRGVPESLSLQAGRRSIRVECPGYVTRSVTYDFEGGASYLIKGTLAEEQVRIGALFFEGADGGTAYLGSSPLAGGVRITSSRGEYRMLEVPISGDAELGQVAAADGGGAPFYFYIPAALEEARQSFVVGARHRRTPEEIDRRRIVMYRAYSALVLSVPFVIGFMGQYRSLSTPLKAVGWASVGVAAGCGVLWIIELARYLRAAASVLPEEADVGD